MRGTLTLGFLEVLERVAACERHGRPDLRLCDYFDLIGGTSAGAILAAALGAGMDARTLVETSMRATPRIFGRHKLAFWESVFDPEPFKSVLTEVFGDRSLGDEGLQTGLCITAKRADTRSTWPLLNHPLGKYYAKNQGILLRDAVYASAAAPYFFLPTEFEVKPGQRGAFVDGGVSMANNPALLLFLIATLQGFPFHWPKGEEQLLLVSVGTGTWHLVDSVDKVVRSKAWDWTREVPLMLMQDASTQVQLLLQYLSRTPTPWRIDSEVGDLTDDLLTAEPALSYLRYDTRLELPALQELGIHVSEKQLESLRSMSAKENCDLLLQIGRAAAQAQVRPDHFPAAFDITHTAP